MVDRLNNFALTKKFTITNFDWAYFLIQGCPKTNLISAIKSVDVSLNLACCTETTQIALLLSSQVKFSL